MKKLLDEIFLKCDFVNGGLKDLFKSPAIKSCDSEIEDRARKYLLQMEKEDREEFLMFLEEMQELYVARDCELSKLLIIRGMSLNMQLSMELLADGR